MTDTFLRDQNSLWKKSNYINFHFWRKNSCDIPDCMQPRVAMPTKQMKLD